MRKYLKAAAVLLVTIAFAACGNDSGTTTTTRAAQPSTSQQTSTTGGGGQTSSSSGGGAKSALKVGVILDLSGPTAASNKFMQESIQLAIDDVNAKGGVNGHRIELIVGDNAGKADQAVSLAVKYIEQDNVVAILGPTLSGSASAVIDQMTKSGKYVPMVGAGSDPSIIHADYAKREWFFNATLDPQVFAAQEADIIKGAGAQKTGSLFTTIVSAQSSKDISKARAQQIGLEWVGDEGVDQAATDVFANAKKLKDAGADSLILQLIPNPATILGWLRAKQQLGWDVKWVTSDITLSSQYASVPELIEGAYVGGICDPRNPAFQAMLSDYEKKYSKKADASGYDALGFMYDGARVLLAAMSSTPEPPTPKGIRDALESTNGFKAACSTAPSMITLSKDVHSMIPTYPFFRFVNGQRQYLG